MYFKKYDPDPLPVTQIESRPFDSNIVARIFPMYTGENGAFTLTNQYFYNHLIADYLGVSDIADAFSQNSLTKMRHCDTLCHLILNYGGDPRLIVQANNGPRFWTGSIIKPEKTLTAMLNSAVKSENANTMYLEAIENSISDPMLKSILSSIINEDLGIMDQWSSFLHRIS